MKITERIENYLREHCPIFQSKEAIRQAYYEGWKDAQNVRWHVCGKDTTDYPRNNSVCALYVVARIDDTWSPERRIIITHWLGDHWDLERWQGKEDMEVVKWAYMEDIM